MACSVIVPMLIVGIVPFFNGKVNWSNFSPFVPLATPYAPAPGAWNVAGWTLVLGGLFIAAWSTYAFETAICYTAEFKNPASDTFNAIFYSGLLCIVVFTLVPFTFQGVSRGDGHDCAGRRRWHRRRRGRWPTWWVAGPGEGLMMLLMMLALLLSAMTAMAGSSRTLYQGSVDGWLPRYLSHVNRHGAPTRAMWTGLMFNLALLTFTASDTASFYFVLGDLQLRLHHLQLPQPEFRLDPPDRQRPYHAAVEGADRRARRRLLCWRSSMRC